MRGEEEGGEREINLASPQVPAHNGTMHSEEPIEKEVREKACAHTRRAERDRERVTPRVEKRALSDQEEQPADSPEKGERVKTGGKKARSGTLWQQAK